LYPLNETKGDLPPSIEAGKDIVETLEPMTVPEGFSFEIREVSLQYSTKLAITLSSLLMVP
jgi:hypothetical protein